MLRVSLVVGQAGTGKTTWLMDRAKEYASVLHGERQKILAITRMHGARRRVELKMRESCRGIPFSVATIDGFALSTLNRWRTALGYMKPIGAVADDIDFEETVMGIEADFVRVVKAATTVLQSPTVRRVIGETFPLILIDEFQDCHGPLFEFVKVLTACSSMLLAADHFQCLDTEVTGCAGIEWVQTLQEDGTAEITELKDCRRTSAPDILDAASCLRDNRRSEMATIPVLCCPDAGPAAWKMIQALVFQRGSDAWNGTTALICPSHDPFVHKVLESCNKQLRNRNLMPIRWHEEHTGEEERKQIRANLGLAKSDDFGTSHWTLPAEALSATEASLALRIERFAKLRGLEPIPREVVERHVDMAVHEKRAYSTDYSSRIVTTVHGAKNREFDNVFILWTHRLHPDREQQRRLLYNAVTRSKTKCVLLVLGGLDRVRNDPVLQLLGPPQLAIPRKKPGESRRRGSR